MRGDRLKFGLGMDNFLLNIRLQLKAD